jgi:hypothetical protein
MKIAGCSARYQYNAVVPAFAAPMTMKLGSMIAANLMTQLTQRKSDSPWG